MKTTKPGNNTLPAVFKAAYIANLSTGDSNRTDRPKAAQTLSTAQQHNVITMETSVHLTSHELIPGVTLKKINNDFQGHKSRWTIAYERKKERKK